MKFKRHGLSVGIERTADHFFLSLKVKGNLTHKDYQTITPIIDSALAEVKGPKVKALVDGTELEGWNRARGMGGRGSMEKRSNDGKK